MAIGAVLGIAQAGLGLLGGGGSNSAATYLQNAAIQAQNQRTKQIWAAQLKQASQQFGQNRASADRAYNSLQLKENEQLDALLLKQKGMLKQLVEFQGQYKAREVYGKSAARLASQPEKEYGEAMRTMQMNMQRFSNQVDRDIAEVARQKEAADASVMAGIAVTPAMVSQIPTLPSSNMGLKIGNALLSGLSTWASMRAPAATGGGGGGGGGGGVASNYTGGVATNAFNGASGLSAGSFGQFGGGFSASNLSLGSFNPFGG